MKSPSERTLTVSSKLAAGGHELVAADGQQPADDEMRGFFFPSSFFRMEEVK